jgi:hypothetical protein
MLAQGREADIPENDHLVVPDIEATLEYGLGVEKVSGSHLSVGLHDSFRGILEAVTVMVLAQIGQQQTDGGLSLRGCRLHRTPQTLCA